jgi:serine/threonine protein phosphatase 1
VAVEIETEGGIVGIVHADCPTQSWAEFLRLLVTPDLPSSQRKALRDAAMWDRSRIESEYRGGVEDVRAVVVGHTPLAQVVVLGNVYHIDTAGWHPSGAGFTFLDADTLETVTVPRQRQEAA